MNPRYIGAETMRHPALIVALVAASLTASLTACAGGPPQESYQSVTERLAADCRAKGGILTPTGAPLDRPETDNVCKINGVATLLHRGQ